MFSINGTFITLTRGDTLLTEVAMEYDGQPYTPKEGETVRMAVKHPNLNDDGTDYADEEPLIVKNIPIDTMILELEPSDTKPLGFGKYAYDIEITFADGRVDTFISGVLNLTKEVY